MLGSESIEAPAARRSYLCVIVRFVHLPGNFSFFSRLETWVASLCLSGYVFRDVNWSIDNDYNSWAKDWWMWVCCHLQFIYRQVSSTCNNWQVISALADADKFGGCRFQWIWRRENPFRRRVASKVFPGGYGSVTCVGVCFLRCKLKIPCLWWLACGLLCWIRDTVQAEISNLHGVLPDVAPCN